MTRRAARYFLPCIDLNPRHDISFAMISLGCPKALRPTALLVTRLQAESGRAGPASSGPRETVPARRRFPADHRPKRKPEDGDVNVEVADPRSISPGRGGDAGRIVPRRRIAGSGRIGELHHELAELDTPGRSRESDEHGRRSRTVRRGARRSYQHSRLEIEARGEGDPHGSGFDDRASDRRLGGELRGGCEDAAWRWPGALGDPDVPAPRRAANHLDIRVDTVARGLHPLDEGGRL